MKRNGVFFMLLFSTIVANAQRHDITEHFTDWYFRKVLFELRIVADSTRIYEDEVANEAVLDVENHNFKYSIQRLDGIEYFRELRTLICPSHHLDSLDLSHNHKLEEVYCQYNRLAFLDVSECKNLKILDCQGNRLQELDLQENDGLEKVVCNTQITDEGQYYTLSGRPGSYPFGEKMTSLLLPKSEQNKLTVLICYGNPLTTLDLSHSHRLDTLICSTTALTELDLSHCPQVRHVECVKAQLEKIKMAPSNQLTYLDCIINDSLRTLDVSSCENLRFLDCSYCFIDTLDVSSNLNLEILRCKGQTLYYLLCGDGRSGTLQKITLPQDKNNRLQEISCGNNQLTELDTRHLPVLQKLVCPSSHLQELDVTQNRELRELDCFYNFIQELDCRNNPHLEVLRCGAQDQTSGLRYINDTLYPLVSLQLDYRHASKNLKELEFEQSPLKKPIKINKLHALETLRCPGNHFKRINLRRNKNLQQLDISKNDIRRLNLKHNNQLKDINCFANPLRTLDLRRNPLMEEITYTYDEKRPPLLIKVHANYEEGDIYIRLPYVLTPEERDKSYILQKDSKPKEISEKEASTRKPGKG